LACVPVGLIPSNDEPRAVELRLLYAWELYDVQADLVARGAAQTPHVLPAAARPAPPGLFLWLRILRHLAERYGPHMSRAMLMQWYSFFFAVLPRHGQLKDGKGIKDKLAHCSLCLTPLVQPLVLANSHWLPQSFFHLIANEQAVTILQPNASPTKPSAVHLPLFCTLSETEANEVRITCEKTRLNKGGELEGVPQLKEMIYGLIRAGEMGRTLSH
jgi:hypothetical protein